MRVRLRLASDGCRLNRLVVGGGDSHERAAQNSRTGFAAIATFYHALLLTLVGEIRE